MLLVERDPKLQGQYFLSTTRDVAFEWKLVYPKQSPFARFAASRSQDLGLARM